MLNSISGSVSARLGFRLWPDDDDDDFDDDLVDDDDVDDDDIDGDGDGDDGDGGGDDVDGWVGVATCVLAGLRPDEVDNDDDDDVDDDDDGGDDDDGDDDNGWVGVATCVLAGLWPDDDDDDDDIGVDDDDDGGDDGDDGWVGPATCVPAGPALVSLFGLVASGLGCSITVVASSGTTGAFIRTMKLVSVPVLVGLQSGLNSLECTSVILTPLMSQMSKASISAPLDVATIAFRSSIVAVTCMQHELALRGRTRPL
jgi:hypothetical protein